MLTGGVCTGSATLLAGPTGSGKTTMGIQFILEGLRRGEHCLLVNFQENPTQLAHQMETIGGKLYSVLGNTVDKVVTQPHTGLGWLVMISIVHLTLLFGLVQWLKRHGHISAVRSEE